MKTRTKILTCIIAVMLSIVLLFAVVTANNFSNVNANSAKPRTVPISQSVVDAQSVLDSFENSELSTYGTVSTFTGDKKFNAAELREIDFIAEQIDNELDTVDVNYQVSYDYENSNVVLSTVIKGENYIPVIDSVEGVAFRNAEGKIDALLEIDGEMIYLSELCNNSVIENVGFFSWLKKATTAIVKTVVSMITPMVMVTVSAVEVIADKVFGLVSNETIESNYKNNLDQKFLVSEDKLTKGFIDDQNQYDMEKWKIGNKTMKDAGCGVIAIYNTLLFFGKIENTTNKNKKVIGNTNELAKIIKNVENYCGTIIGASFGVNALHIAAYLSGNDLKVQRYSVQSLFNDKCNNLADNQIAIMLYWYKDSDGKPNAHYICIKKPDEEVKDHSLITISEPTRQPEQA